MKKGRLFIISGPSRVGKDTIVNGIMEKNKFNLHRVVTFTSRPKRKEDIEGTTLCFLAPQEFKKRARNGFFLEWMPVRGYFFGTPKKEVEDLLKAGKNVLIHIDVKGAKRVAQKIAGSILIFIMPDSLERLKQRMKQAHFSAQQMKIRWQETLKELKEAQNYDYRVVNPEGHPEKAVKQVEKIIAKNLYKSL